nr:ROK family transcriptional regulator [Paenibacillus hamazuiensis]
MKQDNRAHVLRLLQEQPHMTRVKLAELTGLTKQTVTNIIQELLTQQLVAEEASKGAAGVGRPPVYLRFRREKLTAAGIQVTPSYIRGILLDLDATVLYETQTELEPEMMEREDGGSQVVSRIRSTIHTLLSRLPADSCFMGAGIGLQGIIDGSGGRVKFSRYLKLFDYPLKELFSKEFPFIICVDNLVRAFAAGEIWRKRHQAWRHVLCVYADQAVGGAILIDGKLYTGNDWQAGKFGHTKVVRNGRACRCGKKGCVEAHISIPVLLSLAGGHYRDFDEMLHHLNEEAKSELFEEAGRHLGFAIGNAVNLLNPECIIVGGELTKARSWLEQPMLDEMRQTVSIPNDRTPLYISDYDQNNGGIGAASLVFHQWLLDPVHISAEDAKAWLTRSRLNGIGDHDAPSFDEHLPGGGAN